MGVRASESQAISVEKPAFGNGLPVLRSSAPGTAVLIRPSPQSYGVYPNSSSVSIVVSKQATEPGTAT